MSLFDRVRPGVEAAPWVGEEIKKLEQRPAQPPAKLSYWPYCERCRKPFEFDKNEPFAYCGCPGASEWGHPRPAEWVPDPHQAPALHAMFEVVSDNLTGTTTAPIKRIETNEDGSFTVVIDHWPR